AACRGARMACLGSLNSGGGGGGKPGTTDCERFIQIVPIDWDGAPPASFDSRPRLARRLKSPRIRIRNGASGPVGPNHRCSSGETSIWTELREERSLKMAAPATILPCFRLWRPLPARGPLDRRRSAVVRSSSPYISMTLPQTYFAALVLTILSM